MPELTSRPYHSDPARCCQACVFGHGPHAEWCSYDFDRFDEKPSAHRSGGGPLGIWKHQPFEYDLADHPPFQSKNGDK